MNPKRLEELLKEKESIYLEFKEDLDLSTNSGKAKLVREVLSFANSPIRVGYLIFGIEDQTNRVVGMDGFTEETAQQIVAEWCTPSIKFDFHLIEYQGKKLGVMQIYPVRPPYTLKKSTSFDVPTDDPKKQKTVNLRTNQVFLRRGSIIAEAEVEEIIEMAQRDVTDLSDIVSEMNRMTGWLKEISYNGSHPHFEPTFEHSREFIEPTFISMICAMLLAGLWLFTSSFPVDLAALPISVAVTLSAATIRVVDFGVRRIITISLGLGFVLTLWFRLGISLMPVVAQWMVDAPLMGILLNGLAGAIIGFLVSILFEIWHPLGN